MRIKQKLNNNAGASMILALALMLVCVVVSSMVVSTAASGLNRTEKRVTQQQEYLAVSSAAELIAEELKSAGEYAGELLVSEPLCQICYRPDLNVSVIEVGGISYYGYPLKVELVPGATHFLLGQVSNPGVIPDVQAFFCPIERELTNGTITGTGSFDTVLTEACEYVVTNTAVYEKKFSMSVYTDGESDERLPEVQCKFVMDTEFGIQVHVSVKKAEGEEKSDYTMIVKRQAVVNYEDTGAVTMKYCDHQIRVENDGVVEIREEETLERENTYWNLMINWSDPKIIKGVQ